MYNCVLSIVFDCCPVRELTEGIPVFTDDNTRVGSSKVAAGSAIKQVVMSRNIMAMPGMCKSVRG